ncbi:MAG: hypothetical protein V4550_01830 [Gemmatimonadota bacterium]
MKPGRGWVAVQEELLRGIVHSLNNRITSMTAFVEMADGGVSAAEQDMMRNELKRTQKVGSFVGALATRAVEPEALEIRPVLDLALEIHRHHPHIHALECTIEEAGPLLPVRVPRWALLRLLILLIEYAKREDDAGSRSVVVRLSGEESVVRVHVSALQVPHSDAADLATACGGRIVSGGDDVTVELPSLIEVRRREKLAAGSGATNR